jgi:hypothetical protein
MKIASGSAWTAMNRSAEGMKVNGNGMAKAAGDIASTTARVLNGASVLPVDVIDVRGEPDLQDSMMDMKLHSYGHVANGRVLKVADDAFESLLDVMHPKRGSRE